jgi:hypothetical protein
VPFAIISQTIVGNASATFDFSIYNAGNIGAYVYGFSMLNIVNGTPGAQLQNFGITYYPQVETGIGYPTLGLTQSISDDLSPSSSATVSVIAFLGAENPSGINFGVQSMAVGQTGPAYSPEYPPALAASVLSGFALSFGNDSSDLLGLGSGTGLVSVPGSTAMVPLADGVLLGDASYTGTADVGTLILDAMQTGIVFGSAQTIYPSQAVSNPFDSSITNWVFLIQSFYAQFQITDPTPDLVSLQVSGDTTGAPQVSVSFGGEHVAGTSGGGSRVTPAVVNNTVASFLIVGVPPVPPQTCIMWDGDPSYWTDGLTVMVFPTYQDACDNWSTGTGSSQTIQLPQQYGQQNPQLTNAPPGWLAVSGPGPQLFMIVELCPGVSLQFGADGAGVAAVPYPPQGFTPPPTGSMAMTPVTSGSYWNSGLCYAIFPNSDSGLASALQYQDFQYPPNPQDPPTGATITGQLDPGGTATAGLPSGWMVLYGTNASNPTTPVPYMLVPANFTLALYLQPSNLQATLY